MRAVAGVRDLRSILDTHSKWGLSGASGRLCNHTYRQRRVALFRAEAEAASRSRSGQQKQQAASRTQHRVNPNIPCRHTKTHRAQPFDRARVSGSVAHHCRATSISLTSRCGPTSPQAYSNNPTHSGLPPPVGAARRRPPPNPCSVASGALRDAMRWRASGKL